MSQGYGANYADVIEKETVREFCPKEYDALMDAIDKDPYFTFDKFARAVKYDDPTTPDIDEAHVKLVEAFDRATRLTLNLSFHDKEQGDCYDEVDGAYFFVDGMYELTPQGRKYKDKIERKFFVTYG